MDALLAGAGISAGIVRALACVAWFGAVVNAGCVVAANDDIGEECVVSDDCDRAEHVCLLLDERSPAGERVCVPMHDIDEPLACTANADCPAAAFPVDATCVDGFCSCVGDTFDCQNDGLVMDARTCKCIPA